LKDGSPRAFGKQIAPLLMMARVVQKAIRGGATEKLQGNERAARLLIITHRRFNQRVIPPAPSSIVWNPIAPGN